LLPDHPLLRGSPLHSIREGTFIDPRNLVLHVGIRSQAVHNPSDAGEANVSSKRLADDSLTTIFHEGIHWRQLQGTTFGAFMFLLRHARECEVLANLSELSAERRSEVFARRKDGEAILNLSDDGLPEPAIDLSDPIDPIELMRCVFFDNFTIETLFYDPRPLVRPHASNEEIFASACADAMTALIDHHPHWRDIPYAELQKLYRLPDRNIGRLKVLDPERFGGSGEDRELTTVDILEAGAIANELILTDFAEDRRYHAGTEDAISVITERTERGHADFRARARAFLFSSHGFAARVFFAASGLDPGTITSWTPLMTVCDFALNPPLPPIVLPKSPMQDWRDLYPPLRFQLAAQSYREIGRAPITISHKIITMEMNELANLTGLTSPTSYRYPDLANNVPDFRSIVREQHEEELFQNRNSYYQFLLWCQRELWERRRDDLSFSAVPAVSLLQHFRAGNSQGFLMVFGSLGFSPPVFSDGEGNVDHALASTIAFGTWFSLSLLAYGLANDLMFGSGDPHGIGMPQELLDHEKSWPLVFASLKQTLGQNPWA